MSSIHWGEQDVRPETYLEFWVDGDTLSAKTFAAVNMLGISHAS